MSPPIAFYATLSGRSGRSEFGGLPHRYGLLVVVVSLPSSMNAYLRGPGIQVRSVLDTRGGGGGTLLTFDKDFKRGLKSLLSNRDVPQIFYKREPF